MSVYASCGKEHFNLHPQKDGYFYFKHYLSFSVEKELLFFLIKSGEQGHMPHSSFFFSYDLIVNKTHQFQYSKRQNKSWKKWELMHILLFEWRLRARVLAATPGIGIGYVF